MTVHLVASGIIHDGVLVNGKPVAVCALQTWRARADWQIAPGDRPVSCQLCLRLRQLAE